MTGLQVMALLKLIGLPEISLWPTGPGMLILEKDEPYPEWPITINQQDNYGRAAVAFLPEISVTGLEAPVVQVIDQGSKEVVYTLRMNRQSLKPKVFKSGLYTIKVGEPGTERMQTFSDVRPLSSNEDAKVLEVVF